MKKKSTSPAFAKATADRQSAPENASTFKRFNDLTRRSRLRLLIGLCVFITGIFLALLAFGPATTGLAQGTTRAEMTLALAKALDVTPPACVPGQEMFDDVPASNPFCPWIEELVRRGITSGCAPNLYCPSASVTRAQMAPFLVKVLNQPGGAVAGANIGADGTVQSFFNHFGGQPTVDRSLGTGIYTVTFPGLEGQVHSDGAIAVVSLNVAIPGMISRTSLGGNAQVRTWNSSGVLADHAFEIVIMLPEGLL
jgi:hypothetical protein